MCTDIAVKSIRCHFPLIWRGPYKHVNEFQVRYVRAREKDRIGTWNKFTTKYAIKCATSREYRCQYSQQNLRLVVNIGANIHDLQCPFRATIHYVLAFHMMVSMLICNSAVCKLGICYKCWQDGTGNNTIRHTLTLRIGLSRDLTHLFYCSNVWFLQFGLYLILIIQLCI